MNHRAPLDGDVDIEHCPPGQPSAALRQAVAEADRHARQLLPVPLYALRWCRVPRSMRCSHNGATQHRPPAMPVVRLRDDLQPDQAYRTMLHELQHVADAVIIAEISEEEAEQRAEAFVARATRRRVQTMSDVQLLIASGSGICGTCGGVIKPGTPYYRDESGGAGRLDCSHITCPPPAVRLPAVRLTDRGAPSMTPARFLPRMCICGGRITAWGAIDRCLRCGRSVR